MTDPFNYGVNYLANRLGLEPHQARGAVRWMRDVESGLSPTITNPTSGAYGIGQHLGPRKTNLFRSYGPNPSVESQFSFIGDELQSTEAKALQALRGARTEDEAFRIWGKSFERPSPAEYAKATGGYSSGLRSAGRPEGYYDGALNVTLRPEKPEAFPFDAAIDALLGGKPIGEAEPGEDHPLAMIDALLGPGPKTGGEAKLAQPAFDTIEPPGPTPPQPSGAEQFALPPAEAAPAPQTQVPGMEAAQPSAPPSQPDQLLDQLLKQSIEPPAQGQAPPQPVPAQPQALPTQSPSALLDTLLKGVTSSMQGATNILPNAARGVMRGAEAGFTGTPITEPPTSVAETVGMVPGAIGGALLSPLHEGGKALQSTMAGEPVAAQQMLTAAMAGLDPVGRLPGGVRGEAPGVMERLWSDQSGGYTFRRDRGMAEGAPMGKSGVYDIIAPDGKAAAMAHIHISGDTATISNIVGNEALGPAAVRQMARDFLAANPEIKKIQGDRISGGREGGPKHGEEIEVSRRDVLRDDSGALNTKKVADDLRQAIAAAVRDVQMKTAPMAAGEDAGRAIFKDYASSGRLARYRRSKRDTQLRKFSPEDQRAMWEAMDNASVAAQSIGGEAGKAAGMRYLNMLPPEQRRLLMEMEHKGIDLWESARDAGVVAEGAERLPFYVMRGIVEVSQDGISRLSTAKGAGQGLTGLDQFGVNLTTRGPMSRGYLTAAETESAARAHAENAEIVRNIRVLPMAYERFENAIAGRRLINDLKEIGAATGKPVVTEGEQLGKEWFTVDHPAFKTYRPRMAADAEGKVSPIRGPDGKIVMDKVPLYVSREFEGPLRAVMRGESGATYNALMQLKGAAMATIMNSPAIHNAVEWGRALGAMPGKVATFKIYGIGARALQSPQLMERAIKDGLVPIGERGYMQDIEGIASAADLQPGRGLLAKGLGAATDVVSPKAGEAVRRGIDKAGDFWHQKLLWDQVAKLQAGLYNEFARELVKKGVDFPTASKMAAHFANRYAGAIPNEAMSEGAKKILNFALFSRSFTMGNLGVMKDMITGLPRDVRAQIGRDLTKLEQKAVTSMARRKAIGTVMTDVGIMYLSNALLQTGIEALRQDQSIDEVGRAYADRIGDLLKRGQESPLDLLNPLQDVELLRSISPLSENEPGKQERVLLGHKDDGTAVYIRSPVGKIGEEFEGWATRPLEMLKNKEGTIARPLLNILNNDRGFGGRVEQVYNRNPHGLGEQAGVVGNILWEFMRSQTPDLQLRAAGRLLTGKGDWVDAAQAVAPFAGFTVSRGAPGGPAVGEMYQARGEHDQKVRAALPDVRDLVQQGKIDEAVEKLSELDVPPHLQRYYMKVFGAPESRLSPRSMRDFQRYSTPEQKRRMEMQMRRRDERELRIPSAGP